MTNGEKIQSMFPNMNFGTLAQDDVIVNRDYSNNDEPQVFIPLSVWNAEYKEPTTKNDLAHCQHTDEEIAKSFIEDVEAVKDQLPTIKNDLSSSTRKNSKKLEKDFGELDCISRQAVLELIADYDLSMGQVVKGIHALPSVTPQEPKCKDCKWWKDSDGEYRRGCGAESICRINTDKVYQGEGCCYLFEPQESEE